MSRFQKSLFLGSFYLNLFFLLSNCHLLSAYVSVPRSTADTTDKMNAGGDPPDRPGLRDDQRSPEFLDDFWGEKDYYYSEHGIHQTGTVRSPIYDAPNPPYYNLPNTYYNHNDPALRHYDYNNRYYRPYHPR